MYSLMDSTLLWSIQNDHADDFGWWYLRQATGGGRRARQVDSIGMDGFAVAVVPTMILIMLMQLFQLLL